MECEEHIRGLGGINDKKKSGGGARGRMQNLDGAIREGGCRNGIAGSRLSGARDTVIADSVKEKGRAFYEGPFYSALFIPTSGRIEHFINVDNHV